MPKTILMTGGTGFLGSHLIRRIINEDFNIIVIKRSTSNLFRLESLVNRIVFYNLDEFELDSVFEKNEIDVVVHCATNYGRSSVAPTDIIQANLLLPLQLLQIAEKYHIKSFINTDTLLDKRINYYSLSKNQFLEWLNLFARKLVCVNVALEHFYGAFDDRSKFISKVILDLVQGVDSIDLTLGQQKRDFIYIDDVVEAFVKIIEFSLSAPKNLYSYEVGTGEPIKIRDLVESVKILTENNKTKLNFGALPYRDNEVMEFHVNLAAVSQLGWQPKTTLSEGLKYTIELERSHIKQS